MPHLDVGRQLHQASRDERVRLQARRVGGEWQLRGPRTAADGPIGVNALLEMDAWFGDVDGADADGSVRDRDAQDGGVLRREVCMHVKTLS